MRAMSRARAGVALAAAAMVLAGCGGQGNVAAGSSGSSGGQGDGGAASAGGAARAADRGDARGDARDDARGAVSGATDRAVGKPPRGSYDDTSGTRTGTPHAQGAVLAHLPGPSRSTCVPVGERSVVRSGQIGMGSFADARSVFAKAKTPYNAAPSFFYVIPYDRAATAVTVVATRPGSRLAPVVVRSSHLEKAAQWRYFPVHLQIPSRGTWRFQVTVDGDRGCFVASFH
jgi:hypothetical protein